MWLECFPETPSLNRSDQVCQGVGEVWSVLSGPTDGILRYIKTRRVALPCLPFEYPGPLIEAGGSRYKTHKTETYNGEEQRRDTQKQGKPTYKQNEWCLIAHARRRCSRIIRTCIFSPATDRCGTWTLTKTITKCISTFELSEDTSLSWA